MSSTESENTRGQGYGDMQSRPSSQQSSQQQQQQNQQRDRTRRVAHWDQARQDWVEGEPTATDRAYYQSVREQLQNDSNSPDYAARARANVVNRPGYTEPSTLGDARTQEIASSVQNMGLFGLMGRPATQEAAVGVTLGVQLEEARATPTLRDDQFFLNEIAKWGQNKAELSSEYHHETLDSGLPQNANPYEYSGDLALAFLKGGNPKDFTSDKYGFNPDVGRMISILPSQRGVQETSWDMAVTNKAQDVDFRAAIDVLNAAEGLYGPYGQLRGGVPDNRSAFDVLGEQRVVAASAAPGSQPSWLPAGVMATGAMGVVKSGNQPFLNNPNPPMHIQSPVGGLLGLTLWGENKDEVLYGFAGSSVDFVTSLVGWTPFRNQLQETDPRLDAFRIANERMKVTSTPEEYNAFLQKAYEQGILTKPVTSSTFIENPQLTYDYGEFSKWGKGVGNSVKGMLGFNQAQLEAYQYTVEKTGSPLDQIIFGTGYTVSTDPQKIMSAYGGGAIMVAGGEVVAGISEVTGITAALGAAALAHPAIATVANLAVRGGIPLALGGLTYYGASEGFTATPERTTINLGKMYPELVAVTWGGLSTYGIINDRQIGLTATEELDTRRKATESQFEGEHSMFTGAFSKSYKNSDILNEGILKYGKEVPIGETIYRGIPETKSSTLQTGQIYRESGAQSFTTDINIADAFTGRPYAKTSQPKGAILEYIVEDLIKGKPADMRYATSQLEHEITLPKNTEFIINSIETRTIGSGELVKVVTLKHAHQPPFESKINWIDSQQVSSNYSGLDITNRFSKQELQLKSEIYTLDLTNLGETANLNTGYYSAFQRPANVATRAEQAMVMAQYQLTPQEIRLAKTQGLSLNDILGIRELEATYTMSMPTQPVPVLSLQMEEVAVMSRVGVMSKLVFEEPATVTMRVSETRPISGLYGNTPLVGSNLVQNIARTQEQYQMQFAFAASKSDIASKMAYNTLQSTRTQQINTPEQLQQPRLRQDIFAIRTPDTITPVKPRLVQPVLQDRIPAQTKIETPWVPTITTPEKPVPDRPWVPVTNPPYTPVINPPMPIPAVLPWGIPTGGGYSSTGQSIGEKSWTFTNPVGAERLAADKGRKFKPMKAKKFAFKMPRF